LEKVRDQVSEFFCVGLNDSQVLVFRCGQKGNRISGMVVIKSVNKVIKAAKNHFQRNAIKRQGHGIGDGIAQIDEHGIKEPSGPNLQWDAVDRTRPKIGELEQALGGVKGILNAPTATIAIGHDERRQHGWV